MIGQRHEAILRNQVYMTKVRVWVSLLSALKIDTSSGSHLHLQCGYLQFYIIVANNLMERYIRLRMRLDICKVQAFTVTEMVLA